MFDIEKAKRKGIDPKSIEIMRQINENTEKRNSCKHHEFEPGSRLGKYRCIKCGCEEEISFVLGYEQGLKHGRSKG